MKPYYYRIRCLVTGQRYIGSQYGSNADPKNLLTNYTTSSKNVQHLIETYGVQCFVVEKLIPCNNARTLESKVLKKLYLKMGREDFMLYFLNRNVSPGILLDDKMIKKRAENPVRRSRISKSVQDLYKSGYINPFKGKTHSDNTKQHLSEIAKKRFADSSNHPRGFKGHVHKDESRRKISDNNHRPLLGVTGENHPSHGLKWWNNGIEDIRSAERPGEEWMPGRVFKPRKRIKE